MEVYGIAKQTLVCLCASVCVCGPGKLYIV